MKISSHTIYPSSEGGTDGCGLKKREGEKKKWELGRQAGRQALLSKKMREGQTLTDIQKGHTHTHTHTRTHTIHTQHPNNCCRATTGLPLIGRCGIVLNPYWTVGWFWG